MICSNPPVGRVRPKREQCSRWAPARLLLFLCLGLLATTAACADELPDPVIKPDWSHPPARILFVGNSYLYYNDSLHNHVRRMAQANGPLPEDAYQYKSATIGGASLAQHPIDHLLTPGQLGIDEPFELVILQGGSAETLGSERLEKYRQTVLRYADKVRASGAAAALYMTHAYAEPHRRVEAGQAQVIATATIEVANEAGALVLPVGLAFARSYAERPDFSLHESFDGSHPNLSGTYLAACVVYYTLYGRPASTLQYDYFGEVSADDARYLRRIADDTVREFFGLDAPAGGVDPH